MKEGNASWQDQLNNVKDEMGKRGDDAGQSDAKPNTEKVASSQAAPQIPEPKQAKATPQKPSSPTDSVDVHNGKLTMKSSTGEVSIQLSDEDQAAFVRKALQYQEVIIKEKKANVFATYAMAALSGLSAVAIGATLLRSSFSKDRTITGI